MEQLTLEQYQAQERRLAARRSRRGLRLHLLVTVLVGAASAVVNISVAAQFPWSAVVAGGMVIGLLIHWYYGVRYGDEFLVRHQQDVERRAAVGSRPASRAAGASAAGP